MRSRTGKRQTIWLTCFVTVVAATFVAVPVVVQAADDPVVHRIRHEGTANSQAMRYLQTLSDNYGPRFSATPNYLRAAEWAAGQLSGAGIEKAWLERYPTDVPGWTLKKFTLELLEPRYELLTALPAAWSPQTDGAVTGDIVLVEELSLAALQPWRGRLAGKIVLIGHKEPVPVPGPPVHDKDTLVRAAGRTGHHVPDGLGGSGAESSREILLQADRADDVALLQLVRFLNDEDVAAVLVSSSLDFGILEVTDIDLYPAIRAGLEPPPIVFVSREHQGRLYRLVKNGQQPQISLQLDAEVYEDDRFAVNVLAEIEGRDRRLKNEVVLLGAHFDTWHGSPGAADNGAGVAVMMEALRILRAVGVEPARTIRIGLWGSEEQGVFGGSLGYASKRFGDLADIANRKNAETHSLYLNQDTGSGKIRGIFLHGNELVRPFFETAFSTLRHLPVGTITTEDSSGSDHIVFDAYNIPAFEFMQDPVRYGTHQHHTNMDVMEFVDEESLRHNAIVVATIAYLAAKRESTIPRKPVYPE